MLKAITRKVSLILGVLAIFYLILSYQLPSYPYAQIDADAIPKMLGFLLLFLAVLLFFSKQEETEAERQKRTIPKADVLMLLSVCGFILAYIILLEIVGFVIMTMTFVYFCSWYLGYKNHKVNGITSVVFSLSIYLLFTRLLLISLPAGILPL